MTSLLIQALYYANKLTHSADTPPYKHKNWVWYYNEKTFYNHHYVIYTYIYLTYLKVKAPINHWYNDISVINIFHTFKKVISIVVVVVNLGWHQNPNFSQGSILIAKFTALTGKSNVFCIPHKTERRMSINICILNF